MVYLLYSRLIVIEKKIYFVIYTHYIGEYDDFPRASCCPGLGLNDFFVSTVWTKATGDRFCKPRAGDRGEQESNAHTEQIRRLQAEFKKEQARPEAAHLV